MLPLALIFDLDDTIVAYDAVVESCWRTVCERFADRLSPHPAAEVLEAIFQQARWYWSDPERHRKGRLNHVLTRQLIIQLAFRQVGLPEDEALSKDMALMRTQLHEELIQPFPGALDTLRQLHARFPMALITNGAADVQARKLDRFDLRPFFACIMIEGAVGYGKPEPKVFLDTLATLKVSAEDVWMVGDSLTFDIAPAQSLGMKGIWHDVKRQGLPANAPVYPYALIQSINDLPALLGSR